jgi:hypothetical protein
VLFGHEVVALVVIVDCIVLVGMLVEMVCSACAIVVLCARSNSVDCLCVRSYVALRCVAW